MTAAHTLLGKLLALSIVNVIVLLYLRIFFETQERLDRLPKFARQYFEKRRAEMLKAGKVANSHLIQSLFLLSPFQCEHGPV